LIKILSLFTNYMLFDGIKMLKFAHIYHNNLCDLR